MSSTEVQLAGVSLDAPGAATIAQVAGSGDMGAGAYTYKITFTNVYGETQLGTTSNSTTTTTGRMLLTGIPIGPAGTLKRKIYRTQSAGATYSYVATLEDNTTSTYNDGASDASIIGGSLPLLNTTQSINVVKGILQTGAPVAVGVATTASAGSTISDAAVLPADAAYHLVTGADATKGVKMPVSATGLGQVIEIVNRAAAVLKVYPAEPTGTINAAGEGVAFEQEASTTRRYGVTAQFPIKWDTWK